MRRKDRRLLATAMIVGLAGGLALAGCGRKADLDRPGAAASPPPAADQAPAGTVWRGAPDASPAAPAPAAPNRRFPLDPLLN